MRTCEGDKGLEDLLSGKLYVVELVIQLGRFVVLGEVAGLTVALLCMSGSDLSHAHQGELYLQVFARSSKFSLFDPAKEMVSCSGLFQYILGVSFQ